MLFYDLFRHSPEFVEFEKGETILKEGDIGKEMYILIEGSAKIELGGQWFADIAQGDFVGELAVIDGSPRLATVTALTDCKFAVVNRERFQFLVTETPKFALEVMRVLAQRLRKADQLRVQSSSLQGKTVVEAQHVS